MKPRRLHVLKFGREWWIDPDTHEIAVKFFIEIALNEKDLIVDLEKETLLMPTDNSEQLSLVVPLPMTVEKLTKVLRSMADGIAKKHGFDS